MNTLDIIRQKQRKDKALKEARLLMVKLCAKAAH